MKLLMLCEGSPETAHGSFSGSANSLLTNLRVAGHVVESGDVDLYGVDRYVAAAATFSLKRQRWGVRFRLGRVPFGMRSRRATLRVTGARDLDAVLQIGATFRTRCPGSVPYFLYCDSNIRMSERGRISGQSQAASLSPAELSAVVEREAQVYGGAAAIFTLSARLRQSFIEDFGIAPQRVHAVYAGPNLDLSRIPPRTSRTSDRPPTVLFVGVKFERKGGDLLLRAFRQVRSAMPDARLRIVGPKAMTIDEPGVEVLGFLRKDEPADWERLVEAYSTADVFCLPTRFEPFGIVFIEAMFFGLPCVGPDAWAIPEMVKDGETGFLVPPEDVDAIAARLIQVLSDVDLGNRMGLAGRRNAHAVFTWPKVVERMTSVMQSSLATAT